MEQIPKIRYRMSVLVLDVEVYLGWIGQRLSMDGDEIWSCAVRIIEGLKGLEGLEGLKGLEEFN